jgi:hypothetical protein
MESYAAISKGFVNVGSDCSPLRAPLLRSCWAAARADTLYTAAIEAIGTSAQEDVVVLSGVHVEQAGRRLLKC